MDALWRIIVVVSFLAFCSADGLSAQLRSPLQAQNDTPSEYVSSSRPSFDEYNEQRRSLIQAEIDSNFESDVILTPKEQLANEIVMRAKKKELDEGHLNPQHFIPSRHIFEVLDEIRSSDLFKILRKMPKGGILHAHAIALCSANYLVNLTYLSDLWQCGKNGEIVRFMFSRSVPKASPLVECEWSLVASERERLGAHEYDSYIRTVFTLYDRRTDPKTQFSNTNDVWEHLKKLFKRVSSAIKYAPVWKSYFKQALQEVYDDNVQYLEFRAAITMVRIFANKFLSCEYISYSLIRRYMTLTVDFMRRRKRCKCITNPCKSSSKSIQTSSGRNLSMLHQNWFQTRWSGSILRK